MNVIVFGGSGFLGSHVADALYERGHRVTVFDLRESSWLSPGQSFIAGDILDAEAVMEAIRGQEIVYNFAGLADIDEAQDRPLDAIRLNTLGNTYLLEAAKQAGVSRFVFASTVYVNGDSGGYYRCSKQACELFIEEYQRRHGLSYTILRFGTVYGRRAGDRNSVYRYLRQALIDRCIRVEATGEELREYVHVRDAARLSVDVLDDNYVDQHIIVTGHHPTRFRDLLEMIQEIVGHDVTIKLEVPDSGLAANLTHYSLTPYAYRPRIAMKLVTPYYHDLGQGLIDCLHEIDEKERQQSEASPQGR